MRSALPLTHKGKSKVSSSGTSKIKPCYKLLCETSLYYELVLSDAAYVFKPYE